MAKSKPGSAFAASMARALADDKKPKRPRKTKDERFLDALEKFGHQAFLVGYKLRASSRWEAHRERAERHLKVLFSSGIGRRPTKEETDALLDKAFGFGSDTPEPKSRKRSE